MKFPSDVDVRELHRIMRRDRRGHVCYVAEVPASYMLWPPVESPLFGLMDGVLRRRLRRDLVRTWRRFAPNVGRTVEQMNDIARKFRRQ